MLRLVPTIAKADRPPLPLFAWVMIAALDVAFAIVNLFLWVFR